MIHAAALTSPRLQRVLAVLSDGRVHSTRDIVHRAQVMAVSACMSELRQHGAEITCEQQIIREQRRFFYQMTRPPTKNA